MKKICIITPEINRERGGVQAWMFLLKKALFERGDKVSSYSYREGFLNGGLGLLSANNYILATWKMLLFALPFSIVGNSRFIVIIHGDELLNRGLIGKKILKWIARSSRFKIVANSKAIATIFRDLTGRTVDFVQYPFVDFENEYERSAKNKDKVAFVSVTRLVPRKNIANVIEALALLKKDGYSFTYDIVGRGQCFFKIKKLIERHNLIADINLHGYVDDRSKNDILNRSDYFILPSIYDEHSGSIEGFGIVYLEANYFGLPVLSGNTGGMKEAVLDGVTGLHCDGSVADIYDKLKGLLSLNFNPDVLKSYAEGFNYKRQKEFFDFVDGWFNE